MNLGEGDVGRKDNDCSKALIGMISSSSAEDVEKDLLGVGSDPVGELDVKLDQEVPLPRAVLGVGQALPLHSPHCGGLDHIVFHVEGD